MDRLSLIQFLECAQDALLGQFFCVFNPVPFKEARQFVKQIEILTLCAALVDRGYFVVRMDNRDSGLSTRLTRYDGRKRRRVYTMQDMAEDVLAVADATGADRVHLVGASLGASIAQVAAIHHADRIASLTLLSAISGAKLRLARPKIRTLLRSMKRPLSVRRGSTRRS